jgi:hypothetical protein
LYDEQKADTSTEITWLSVETCENEDTGLTEGEDNGEELLRSLVQLTVRLEIEVDIDEVGASEELEAKSALLKLGEGIHILGRPCQRR